MKGLFLCCLFFALFLFLTPLEVTAQTPDAATEEMVSGIVEEVKPDAIVVVMPVKSDDQMQARQFQDAMTVAVNTLDGYTARQLSLTDHPEYGSAFPNAAPALNYLVDSSFALTSEHYLDTDGRQRFQAWLWESSTGAPIFTDEMVFDEMPEAMDYLPGLISWIISLIPPEIEPPLTREQVREIVYEILSEMDFSSGTTIVESVETTYFHLYTGMWVGGALASYTTRGMDSFSGGLTQGFDGELALTFEYRPWRYLGFQLEALLLLESLNVYKKVEGDGTDMGGADHFTAVSTTSLSLIAPLLFKLPFEVRNIGLRLVFGPYFVLPLSQTKNLMESITGQDALFPRMVFPFGFTAGVEIGFRLGRWEILGGVRYSKELSELTGPPNGPYSNLRFNRDRITITLGFRVGFLETGGNKKAAEEEPPPEMETPTTETEGEEDALPPPDAAAEEEEAVE